MPRMLLLPVLPVLPAILLLGLAACSEGPAPGMTNTATAAPAAPAAAAPDPAAACRACHQGPLAFTGQDPADLATRIQAVLDGQRAHPPVQLADASPAAVQAIATALTAR